MPIVMDIENLRMRGSYPFYLVRNAANLVLIRALHAKLNRPADRRPKEQPVDLEMDAWKIACENVLESLAMTASRFFRSLGMTRVCEKLWLRSRRSRGMKMRVLPDANSARYRFTLSIG